MKKNSCGFRVITGVLALAIIVGMLPAGALRAYAAAGEATVGNAVAIETEKVVTVYERVTSLDTCNNDAVTEEANSKPVLLGFGEETFYALTHADNKISVSAAEVTASVDYPGYYVIANGETLSKWYYQDSSTEDATGISTSWEQFSWNNGEDTDGEPDYDVFFYDGRFLIPNTYWDGALNLDSNNPWQKPNLSSNGGTGLFWTATMASEGNLPINTEFYIGVKDGAVSAYTKAEVDAEGFNKDLVSMYAYAPVLKSETVTTYAALKSGAYTFDLASGNQDAFLAEITANTAIVLSDDATIDGNDTVKTLDQLSAQASWQLSGELTAVGTYTLRVSYAGQDLGNVQITVENNTASTSEATSATTEATSPSTEATSATEESRSGLTLSTESVRMNTYTSVDITALVEEENVKIVWKSDNKDVAGFYGYNAWDGDYYEGNQITLYLRGEGTTTVTVTAGEHTAQIQVESVPYVFGWNPSPVKMQYGETVDVAISMKDMNGNEVADQFNFTGVIYSAAALTATNGNVFALQAENKDAAGELNVSVKKGERWIKDIKIPVNVSRVWHKVEIQRDGASVDAVSLNLSENAQLTAAITDIVDGTALPGAVAVWSTSNPNVATVDANGVVTAVAPGTAEITASCEGVTDTVSVTVANPTSVVFALKDDTASVNVGMNKTLEYTLTVMAGETQLEATPVIVWTSQNSAAALVENGVVAGVAKGSANISAQVTKLTVNGVTFDLDYALQVTDTVAVTVTEDPMVAFDPDAMPGDIRLDAKENKTVRIPLSYIYMFIADTENLQLVISVEGQENAGTEIAGWLEGNELVISATQACEARFTVQIVSATDAEGNAIAIDPNGASYVVDVTVVDNSDAVGTVTMEQDSMSMILNQKAPIPAVKKVMHGTYEVTDFTVSYSSDASGITVDPETGIVTAGGDPVEDAIVTVTVSYTYGGVEKTASTTFAVDVIDYVSPYVLNLGADYPGIYVGTEFTVVPHVDLKDHRGDITPYTIQWVSSNPSVVSVSSYTYGGPMAANANGIQFVGNGEAVLQAKSVGTATITAYLVDVNGHVEVGVFDSMDITVVNTNKELKAGDLYATHMNATSKELSFTSMAGTVYDVEQLCQLLNDGTYELRIKDVHTFQKDSNGLDARVIAVVGDNHIDFSNVTLNVYDKATGQLVLDEGTLKPVEIPAGMLTFYDVETANVGWVPVRVTFKDYWLHAGLSDGDLYKYEELTTGVNGSDGIVWMYVQETPVAKTSAQVEYVDAQGNTQTANVTLKVDRFRPWLGAGIANTTEHSATNSPLQNMEEYGSSVHDQVLVRFLFSYAIGEDAYVLDADPEETAGCYEWHLEGNTMRHCQSDKADMNVWDRQDYLAYEIAGIENNPAIGYLVVQWNKIKVGTNYYDLKTPVSVRVPIIIREDSVFINPKVTYGLQLDNAWGGPEGYNYISVMGAGPDDGGYYISSYGIEYRCDLPEDKYDVGIRKGSFGFNPGTKGTWHDEFRVYAPLGTSAVTPYLYSITRLNGTVIILDEGDREGGADYTIEVDPQLMILKASQLEKREDESEEDYQKRLQALSDLNIPNTGTVKATIRDKEGNQITVDAEVKWSMRNYHYATSGFVTQQELNASATESVAAAQSGVTTSHTITGQHVGVTYYTAQLIRIQEPDGNGNLVWTDVSKHNIADYVIIDVVDAAHKGEMDVVIDYSKPVKIDISKFIAQEEDYNFLGFSDLNHSLRKHAYTEYGEIEITSSEEANYVLLNIMEGVDSVYVIFQHVEETKDGEGNVINSVYTWHHYLVNVIPATVMYYETDGNAANAFTYNGDWEVRSSTTTNSQGNTVVVGKNPTQNSHYKDSATHNEIYGYDSNYADDPYLSDGTALYAEGVDAGETVKVSFTFTGNGFEIIGRTGAEQGDIIVSYTNVKTGESKRVAVINKGVEELYQIPVVSITDLPYGTYEVTVGVYKAWVCPAPYDFLSRGNQFYFDAIRIYNTAKNDSVAQRAYMADGEYNPTLQEIVSMLISAESFNTIDDSGTTGIVYLDGGVQTLNNESLVQTYKEIGPNHEVYIAPNNGIAFAVSVDDPSILGSIQVGAKTVTGNTAKLSTQIRGTTTDSGFNSTEQSIATSATMFYDLMKDATVSVDQVFTKNAQNKYVAYVVIKNTGEGILSITELKIAYSGNGASATILIDPLAARAAAPFMLSNHTPVCELAKGSDGGWYYTVDGIIDTEYRGLVRNKYGLWYVANGTIDFGYTGLAQLNGVSYYILKGAVASSVNGLMKVDGQWLYFCQGAVDTGFVGLVANRYGTWFVCNGAIDFSENGIVETDRGLALVRNGLLSVNYTGLYKNDDGTWLYLEDGIVNTGYTGLAKNSSGWWYVCNGKLDFTYTGTVATGNGCYNVRKGLVDVANPVSE